MKNTMQDIRDTYHNLDITSLESELEAQKQIDYESGDFDETPAEDVNVPDSMPFAAAVAVVDGVQDEAFQLFRQAAQTMMDGYLAESKNLKSSQDHRTVHANMAMGIEKLLVAWSEYVAEANDRVKNATTEEKRQRGVRVKPVVNKGPAPVEEPIIVGPSSEEKPKSSRPPSAPSAGVQKNTKAAQEWLKSNATRD
jgi:hypothetical protein